MREARLILPERDNDGNSLTGVHEALQDRLCDAFGGFTLTYGKGGWKNDAGLLFREAVYIYDVAVKDAGAGLRQIAQDLRVAARQEAVYLRLPTGDVVFVRD